MWSPDSSGRHLAPRATAGHGIRPVHARHATHNAIDHQQSRGVLRAIARGDLAGGLFVRLPLEAEEDRLQV